MTLPIVLIPGHLCGSWLYAPLQPALAGREVTLAETHLDGTIHGMAERLLAAAPPRFVVAGLSMGGMVATEVMALAPERVAGACLIDTDPTPARPKEIAWRWGLLGSGLAVYVDAFVERFYAHDRGVAQRLGPSTRASMVAVADDVARTQARALDSRRDMAGEIEGYSGPVTLIAGAEDRVCPPFLHGVLAARLADAQVIEIAGCGHLSTLERPEPVTRALQDLIGRAEATTVG